MNPRRILFVDDEPQILDGLRLLLRQQRRQWQMVFVDGAPAALAELERGPFDVVVSDMRMPGTDGAELLTRIAERWPATVRLILSGYSDPEAMTRARLVAHQCLSKPCELEVLRQAINGALPAGDQNQAT